MLACNHGEQGAMAGNECQETAFWTDSSLCAVIIEIETESDEGGGKVIEDIFRVLAVEAQTSVS